MAYRKPNPRADENYDYDTPGGYQNPELAAPAATGDPNAPVPLVPNPDPNATPPPDQPKIVPDPDPNAPPRVLDTGGYAKPGYIATNYNQTAVSGYDPAKWGDPLHQTPKYVVGRILSGYNLNDPTQLKAAMADIAKAYPGTTWAGKDTVNIPGIGLVDVIRDFGGESGIAWQPESDRVAAPTGGTLGGPGTGLTSLTGSDSALSGGTPWYLQPGGTGTGTSTGIGTGTTTSSTTASSGLSSDPALEAARREALLELLNRKPPTAQELMDSPENQAYRLAAQRAEERDRAQLAETAAFEGFDNTGFFDTELRGIQQQRGEGEAGFLGELAVTRMQAQREDLQFAIAEAQQAGQFDLAQQLQREQMTLDAAIRREQMASSERMAANELALRDFLGRAGIDLDRLRLGENARQFNYDLGYRYGVTNLNSQNQYDDFVSGG